MVFSNYNLFSDINTQFIINLLKRCNMEFKKHIKEENEEFDILDKTLNKWWQF